MKVNKLMFIAIFLVGSFLRLFHVSENPPGLYIDEVSIGYNAFSVLRDGVDEHGVSYPLFFEAFGEYKMPVYIYSVAAFMSVLGKSDLAVRLPSIVTGILTIPLFYLFLKKLLYLNSKSEIRNTKQYQNSSKKKFKQSLESGKWKMEIPIIATALLAITPWHLHFSRAGFEATPALFLFLSGLYLFLLFWTKKSFLPLFLSFFFFALSMYTYNSYRIIAPLTVGIASVFIFVRFPKLRKKIIGVFIIFLLLISPIINFSLTDEGTARFSEASAFSEFVNKSPSEKVSIYPMVIAKNYLSYFSLDYLFVRGDGNGRHQVPGFGLFLHYLFPFIIVGIAWLIAQKRSIFKIILLYLFFIAPIPASIVSPSPHSLRSLLMVIPISVFAAIGIYVMAEKRMRLKKVVILFVVLAAIYEFGLYLHQYYFHYNKVNSKDWGSGFREVSQKASKYKKNYKYIVVDRNLSNAEIYLKFYDDSIQPVFVDSSWRKPAEWSKEKAIYIRPYYGENSRPEIIDHVNYPGVDEIHAQFWKL